MADDATSRPAKTPAEPVRLAILLLVGAALVSAAAGFALGRFVFAPMMSAMAVTAPAPETGTETDPTAPAGGQRAAPTAPATVPGAPIYDYSGLSVVKLDPITTSMAAPVNTWLRAEMALAVEGEVEPAMVAQIEADIVAYLRTVRLHALSTPSGFQHIVTDLRMRAAERSNGQVKNVFVTALLVE